MSCVYDMISGRGYVHYTSGVIDSCTVYYENKQLGMERLYRDMPIIYKATARDGGCPWLAYKYNMTMVTKCDPGSIKLGGVLVKSSTIAAQGDVQTSNNWKYPNSYKVGGCPMPTMDTVDTFLQL